MDIINIITTHVSKLNWETLYQEIYIPASVCFKSEWENTLSENQIVF